MSLFPPHIITLSSEVLEMARVKKALLATAESCTGGLIAGCLTEIAGSSDVFDRSFVTYSNNAKIDHVDVSEKTLASCGAVSAETAEEMARGLLRHSKATIGVAVTGIAGPGGGSIEKPVGLVYLGIAVRDRSKSYAVKKHFSGDRCSILIQTVETALHLLKQELQNL